MIINLSRTELRRRDLTKSVIVGASSIRTSNFSALGYAFALRAWASRSLAAYGRTSATKSGMKINLSRKELRHTRTFSAASLHKKQASGHIFASCHAEHLEGSGEEQSSPSSFLLRTCSCNSQLTGSHVDFLWQVAHRLKEEG